MKAMETMESTMVVVNVTDERARDWFTDESADAVAYRSDIIHRSRCVAKQQKRRGYHIACRGVILFSGLVE